MYRLTGVVGGAIVGAMMAYLCDPHGGHRRRSVLRDRSAAACRRMVTSFRRVRRGTANVLRGAIAEARRQKSNERVDDDVLVERVRAQMGHAVHHPRSVEVHASAGVVTLTGSIAGDQYERLVDAIADVPGVKDVVNHLVVVAPTTVAA